MNAQLSTLIENINQLHKDALQQYTAAVETLIAQKETGNRAIENLLERMLDFCGDEAMLVQFKKLCRYYWTINPLATAEYVNCYRNIWDNENDKEQADNEK